MNEQIKKIADTAKKFHYQSLIPATHSLPVSKVKELANQANSAGIEIISDEFCERFAELMVEKFDLILVNEYLDCVGENDKKSQFRIDRLRNRVKEYFGVER